MSSGAKKSKYSPLMFVTGLQSGACRRNSKYNLVFVTEKPTITQKQKQKKPKYNPVFVCH